MSKIKRISELKYRFFPLKKRTMLFDSFHGNYSCNPRYISQKIHELAPDVSIVWSTKGTNLEEYPDYVTTVEYDSIEFYKYYYQAQVRVDNYFGEARNIRPDWLAAFFSKRKGQLILSTWHGKPFKKIGLDAPETKGNKRALSLSCSDFMLEGSSFSKKCYEHVRVTNPPPFLKTGYPRNDILFAENDKERLKEQLGLPKDKKVFLYAPSFRESIENSGVAQMKSIRYEELFHALHDRFGGEWVFVFRVHNLVVEKIDKAICSTENGIYNGNLHDDMAEYMACADVFVTDHSASMMDVVLTSTPCFLYLYDYKCLEEERGFYFKVDELPFSSVYDFEQLLEAIENYDADAYEIKRKAFLEKTGDCEDGQASYRVARGILEFMDFGKTEYLKQFIDDGKH